MEHSMHLVDILNTNGSIVGAKRRIDIIKPDDIYHTIHVLLITPRGEIILSDIPVREDLPNLYARKKGTTVATIRRTNESPSAAAERCVSRELFIDHMMLVHLGTRMYQMPTQRYNYMSTFYGISEAPESYSLIDIAGLEVITPHQLDEMIEHTPDNIAESLTAVWQEYKSILPI